MTVLTLADCPPVWESASPDATVAMAEALGQLLRPGDVVVLGGDLGSGKTVFVRGLALGLGCPAAAVHSPSFTLVNEYPCGREGEGGRSVRLAHVDLYRIASADELPGIGWDEYLHAGYVVAVEWPDRAAGWLPRDHVRVSLEPLDASRRRLQGEGTGPRSAGLVREWMRRLCASFLT
jgi:tRNA threonylcarbamoyladenosine biosynthesis protein TsaE